MVEVQMARPCDHDAVHIDRDALVIAVGDEDSELAHRLDHELTGFNTHATGINNQRALSVQMRDAAGSLVAGLTGWTWGTCAGINMVWVIEDLRRTGLGGRLLEAAETEARERGCVQIL